MTCFLSRTPFLLAGPRSRGPAASWATLRRGQVVKKGTHRVSPASFPSEASGAPQHPGPTRWEGRTKLEDAKEELGRRTAKLQKKTKSATAARVRKQKPSEKAVTDPMARSLKYAGKMLANVPEGWFEESSVAREALGIVEERPLAIPEAETGILPEASVHFLPPADDPVSSGLLDLERRVNSLEEQALSVRQRSGRTKPQLASAEAYLAVIERCPTGVEAATWLDELEMTAPEWLLPHHYEATFKLATESGTSLPERDILIIWLKSRQRKMITPTIYAHLFATLGESSLRAVAFPFLWEACKRDFGGAKNVDPSVAAAVFLHAKKFDDVSLAVSVYLELSKACCRISILGYLELIALLSTRTYKDQEVLDFVLCELQDEAGRIIASEGISGIPREFFSKALAGCSPESALRLWRFMMLHNIRVTVEDYTNLLATMSNSLRLLEARSIFKYLERHHPDYLWYDSCKIPKMMLGVLRLYKTKAARADMLFVFSEYFGPSSGTLPSRTAYLHLMDGCDDEQFVHELWREMLARGIRLETKHYNMVFRNMGGIVPKQLPYALPPSILDEELPAAMVEAQVSRSEPPMKFPTPVTDSTVSWSPYSSAPNLALQPNILREDKMSRDPVWVPPTNAYDNLRRPHLAKEEILPNYFTKYDAKLSTSEYKNIAAAK
ncbi:hypothetical protein DIPPA_70112a, partial [Diplonema papillatum]